MTKFDKKNEDTSTDTIKLCQVAIFRLIPDAYK